MAEPPGGPADSTPPRIKVVSPMPGTVVPGLKGDAVIQFDEVIDEMASGAGGGTGSVAGIGRQIVLSPVAGAVEASWHRTSIHVKPSEGWKPGRVYHLELLPGVMDLRRNVLKRDTTFVFSTGPELPHASLSGTVLQWVEQHALARGVIRAAHLPDTVAYITVSDSMGSFSLTDLPPGRYRVTAILDQNGNRLLDPREAFDSTTVTTDSSAAVVLWAFVHDTVGPKLRNVDPGDSVSLRLTFSQPLDPHLALDSTRVHLFALPDTSPVRVAAVWKGVVYDSSQARARAVQDSIKRANDTTARKGTPVPPAPGTPRAGGPARDTSAHAPVDTSRAHRLLLGRPVPTDRYVVSAATALTRGGKYLVRVRGAVNLNGVPGEGQVVVEIPKPKALPPGTPKDTTRAHTAPKPP